MKCPVCVDATLLMTERQGVEIDYCPQCRGVWLDRGELDKLIERSMAPAVPSAVGVEGASLRMRDREGKHHDERRHHDDDHHQGDRHRRRQSWLKDLFD